jgi:hypothetical protein
MEKLTVCRLTVGIGHLRALVGAFVLTIEGANSTVVEFLVVVTRLEPSLTELRDTLDQGGQSHVHQWLFLLSLDDEREHKFVLP